MNIAIWVEPKMYVSNWYHELELGLRAALNAKHIQASILPLEHPDILARDSVIILVGETYEWYNKMLTFTNQHQLTACVAGCEHPMHSAITVTSDYAQVTYNMIQYLYNAGKKKLALFGVNPSSPHDNYRLEAYLQAIKDFDLNCDKCDIYYTNGDINQCASIFLNQIKNYDAVLGVNDLYAFFALMIAVRSGLHIPDDLFIVGFGNTTISSICKPPITTATINLFDIGYKAIAAIQFLSNNSSINQLDIKCDDIYFARESTQSIPFAQNYIHRSNHLSLSYETINGTKPVTSFGDSTFMDLVSYESLLRHIDAVDYSIINSIISKQLSRKNKVAEICFLSDSALDYRLKRLYKRINVTCYHDFYEKLLEMVNYIDLSKLKLS